MSRAGMRRFWLTLLLIAPLAGCGGGGGGSSTTASQATDSLTTLAANQIAVTVESYPAVTSNSTVNLPYVTIQVCDANGTCETVDHVIVDTGSYGLRLLKSAVPDLDLPPTTTSGGSDIAECATFLDGTMWGSVAAATVKMGDEVAQNIPVQLVGDSAVGSSPSGCTAHGTDESTLNGIGGNGLLGIGQFVKDGGLYFSCTSAGTCTLLTGSDAAAVQQVSNPVAAFATDNNGVILEMPSISTSGATTATGRLTFGIDTQSNNSLTGYSVLQADTSGNFTVSLEGQTYGASFIDSGSNVDFATLSGLSTDSNGIYAPSALTTYPVVMTPNTGGTTSISADILAIDLAQISSGMMALNDVVAPGSSSGTQGWVDLGLPFFYGRSVALVINGNTTADGTGPLYAIK